MTDSLLRKMAADLMLAAIANTDLSQVREHINTLEMLVFEYGLTEWSAGILILRKHQAELQAVMQERQEKQASQPTQADNK